MGVKRKEGGCIPPSCAMLSLCEGLRDPQGFQHPKIRGLETWKQKLGVWQQRNHFPVYKRLQFPIIQLPRNTNLVSILINNSILIGLRQLHVTAHDIKYTILKSSRNPKNIRLKP